MVHTDMLLVSMHAILLDPRSAQASGGQEKHMPLDWRCEMKETVANLNEKMREPLKFGDRVHRLHVKMGAKRGRDRRGSEKKKLV